MDQQGPCEQLGLFDIAALKFQQERTAEDDPQGRILRLRGHGRRNPPCSLERPLQIIIVDSQLGARAPFPRQSF
jgi:hypothetical protein